MKVVTDGCLWYPWAARTLELEHEVMNSGIRSHVERLIEAIKDHAKVFDRYYSCRCGRPGHVWKLIFRAGLYLYNFANIAILASSSSN